MLSPSFIALYNLFAAVFFSTGNVNNLSFINQVRICNIRIDCNDLCNRNAISDGNCAKRVTTLNLIFKSNCHRDRRLIRHISLIRSIK